MAKKPRSTSSSDAAAAAELNSSDDIRNGYLTGPGVDRLPVQYAVIDGRAIFDSCIDMGSVEEVEIEAAMIRAQIATELASPLHAEEPNDTPADDPDLELMGVGLPTDSSRLWPNGIVPFLVNSSVQNPGRINQAIVHLRDRTAIRLVPRTNQANFVEFIGDNVNQSRIGMVGGRQVIRLSANAPVGTVVHEILHALGIYHEQSRSDRDAFVEIRWQNIQQNAIGNFQTVPGSIDYYDYDYGSVMHYPSWAFQIDPSQDTIVPRQAGVTIGQRDGLSWTDRQTIAKLYERFFAVGYSGVWRAGSGRYAMWINATWDSFRSKWQEWTAQGLRLVDIHTRRVGNQTRYSGVFLPGTGGHGLWANVSFESFRAKNQEWTTQGLRLVSMHIHRVGNENRFSGAWLPGSGGHGLWVNATWNSFHSKWQEWNGRGLRLIDLHVHKVNGTTRYSGVWSAGAGGHGLWANVTWNSFVSKWREWAGQGLRLVDIAIHRDNGRNRYSGVFRAGSGSHYLWANVTWEGFRAKWEELAEQRLRLVDFDFPAPEIGGLSDADARSLEDSEHLLDPGLDLDGFGGLFEDPAETPAPGQHGDDKLGLGGLVMNGDTTGVTAQEPDGEGGAHLVPSEPPADELVDERVGLIGGGE